MTVFLPVTGLTTLTSSSPSLSSGSPTLYMGGTVSGGVPFDGAHAVKLPNGTELQVTGPDGIATTDENTKAILRDIWTTAPDGILKKMFVESET